MNSVRSMTGYARVRKTLEAGEMVLSLRAVNHRALDLHFHLPSEFDPYEPALRKALTGAVTRGHVEVRGSFTRTVGEGAGAINQAMLAAWVAAFRKAAEEFGLHGEPDLNVALRIPGILTDPSQDELGASFGEEVVATLREALEALNREREREGGETASAVRAHAERIAMAAGKMEEIRNEVMPLLQERLAERITDLLRGSAIEPVRLAQEAALLADRSDVSEELTRLRIHTTQIAELMTGGGETGKRLEFLAQEMHREANTILSKSNSAGEPGRRIADLALSVKSEIEKIREQSLNLE